MRRHFFYITLMYLFCGTTIFSQNNHYNISIFGSYTLSSKIFYNLEESSPSQRNQFLTIYDIFGIGMDIRREFPQLGLELGLSIEYLETKRNFNYEISPSGQVPVKDGYRTIPIEINGYFLIPINLPGWKFKMGTGFGLYWGTRNYSYASVLPAKVNEKIGMGIQVITEVEYLLSSKIGLRTEIKFREIQFWTTERFKEDQVIINENIIKLTEENIQSKISIDGMLISLGIVYYLD